MAPTASPGPQVIIVSTAFSAIAISAIAQQSEIEHTKNAPVQFHYRKLTPVRDNRSQARYADKAGRNGRQSSAAGIRATELEWPRVTQVLNPTIRSDSRMIAAGPILAYRNTGIELLYSASSAGLPVGDDIQLTTCACLLDRLEILVNGGGDGTGPGFTASFYLSDGCPDSGTPIPDAAGSVSLPDDGDHLAVFDFPAAGPLTPDEFWLVVWFDTPDAGWYAGSPADIGFTQNVFWPAGFGCNGAFPGVDPPYAGFYANVYCEPEDDDCNNNGVFDACELDAGTAQDCNNNISPDECDVEAGTSADCNGDGIPDECISSQADCNDNNVPDECDVLDGTSPDCNGNLIPDECIALEPDCNGNNVPDPCDTADGTSADCNGNSIPDECISLEPDCNGNNIPDPCDTAGGTSADCNGNGIPDECIFLEADCNGNSVPDACDTASGTSPDCNGNSIPDECIALEDDCNANNVPDACDVASGTSEDCDGDGLPDECVTAINDCNGNDIPDQCDIANGIELDCNPPAVVFSNTIYPWGLFDNERDLSNDIFFFRVGAGGWIADDWFLDTGTSAIECTGLRLRVAVHGGGMRCLDAPEYNRCETNADCSTGTCQASPSFDATVDVFPHDPTLKDDGLVNSVGGCLEENPPPGAFHTTFTNLDGLSTHVLTVDLDGQTIGGPPGGIWARVGTNTDSSGWVLGSNGDTIGPISVMNDAEVGFTDDFTASYGLLQGFCGLVFFAAPQFSMWGTITCQSAIEMSLQPAFATGVECVNGAADDPATCDWYIDGPNSIVLHRPGQDISSEVFISGWDNDGMGTLLAATTSGVDCALFDSGTEGSFRPPKNADCIGDFSQVCHGVDLSRSDSVFAGVQAVVACSSSGLCPDGSPGLVECGGTVLIGEGVPDDGTAKYVNTYGWIDEFDDARGTFYLNVSPDPQISFAQDQNVDPIGPITRTPMRVTIVEGACCGVEGEPLSCIDGVLFDECASISGTFLAGAACTGLDADGDGLDNACPIPGRCCAIEAALSCDDTIGENECQQQGGEFQGEFESCGGVDANNDGVDDACDPLGRCCGAGIGETGCMDTVTAGECNDLGGSIFVVGVSCAGADADGNGADDACPLLGACCFVFAELPPDVTNSCGDNFTLDECTSLDGEFLPNQRCAGAASGDLDDTCRPLVPAVSTWGLVVLALLLLTAYKARARGAFSLLR